MSVPASRCTASRSANETTRKTLPVRLQRLSWPDGEAGLAISPRDSIRFWAVAAKPGLRWPLSLCPAADSAAHPSPLARRTLLSHQVTTAHWTSSPHNWSCRCQPPVPLPTLSSPPSPTHRPLLQTSLVCWTLPFSPLSQLVSAHQAFPLLFVCPSGTSASSSDVPGIPIDFIIAAGHIPPRLRIASARCLTSQIMSTPRRG